MGVDICWRFQREEKPGKWINLSSNYKGDRSYLHFAWLGFDVDREWASTSGVFIHALRGLPDDIPSEDGGGGGHNAPQDKPYQNYAKKKPQQFTDGAFCRHFTALPMIER
ncbi:TPA: hypothetical protein ACNV2O_005263 [Citrobacter freundii]